MKAIVDNQNCGACQRCLFLVDAPVNRSGFSAWTTTPLFSGMGIGINTEGVSHSRRRQAKQRPWSKRHPSPLRPERHSRLRNPLQGNARCDLAACGPIGSALAGREAIVGCGTGAPLSFAPSTMGRDSSVWKQQRMRKGERIEPFPSLKTAKNHTSLGQDSPTTTRKRGRSHDVGVQL